MLMLLLLLRLSPRHFHLPRGAMPSELFVYYEDTESITEELTRAFLSKIEEEFQLSRHGDNANMTEIVEAFQGVARDVLNFLRYHNSQAILPLLREFSTQGTITVTNVSPDLLNQEVQQLLNVTQLGRWYADAASFDHPSITTVPPNWSSPRVSVVVRHSFCFHCVCMAE